jgi:hypothetical protein
VTKALGFLENINMLPPFNPPPLFHCSKKDRIPVDDDNEDVRKIENCVRIRFDVAPQDWNVTWRAVVDSINQMGRQYNYQDRLQIRGQVEEADLEEEEALNRFRREDQE